MTVYPDDQDPSFTVAYTDKSVADGYVRVVLCPVCGRGLLLSISVCPCDGQGQQYGYSSTTNPLPSSKCQHVWVESETTLAGWVCRKCNEWRAS